MATETQTFTWEEVVAHNLPAGTFVPILIKVPDNDRGPTYARVWVEA